MSPAGKPVATEATGIPEPSSALTAGRDHGRIDADRADRGREIREAERGEKLVAQRPARLGAEAAHALGRVVAGERGQVDAGHRLHEPGGLVFLLDRAAGGQRRRAALDGARVDADALEPVGSERHARIAGAIVPRPSRVGDSLVHGASQTRVPDGEDVTIGRPKSKGRAKPISASPAPTQARYGANPKPTFFRRRNAEAGPRQPRDAWNEFKIRRNEIKTSRNKIKVRRNEIQIRRNKIQISLPSSNLAFSMAYRRLRPGGPAKPARRPFAAARTDSEQQVPPFVKKMSIFEKSRPRRSRPLAAVGGIWQEARVRTRLALGGVEASAHCDLQSPRAATGLCV